MEDYILIDNTVENQYEFHIDDYIPKVEYIKSVNGEIFFTHTEVPGPLEGQGIGSQLIEKALADIDKKRLVLVPLCPFVARYINTHPEWSYIIKKRM
jgi:Predicted acetyltransferase